MTTTLNSDMSNTAILTELGYRIKQLRLSKNKDQQQCAFESGISLRTLSRLENGHSVSLEAALKVIRTLDLIGRLDLLVPTVEISPVQQAKNKRSKPRLRASSRRETSLTAQQAAKANHISEQETWGGFTKPTTFEPKSSDETSE